MKAIKVLLLAGLSYSYMVHANDIVPPGKSKPPATTLSNFNSLNVIGQWSGDFFYMTPDDLVGQYRNTNGHCLKEDGTWYMTNNKAGGHWFQVGDRIYLHGGGNGFSGSAELTVIKPRVITGHWQSWTADDSFHAFFTAYWKFISSTCLPPFEG